ncbi:zf-C2H2 Zinc finger, C2H2 type [Scheffersomyces spartinae]|uniref:Zf-C2H2 Zinc finger, C2H2 type n=1 Tax=Scheffersomyces spartinae TaxID=45513 RepID=A0A9P7V907_9ASCO|nr:zf-C2H2 Zinc finger, C2H2 type [Scheffersomyces spartinae]KAG7193518.1 zf-C2H2 Zinc finger, C2H2 type [Scheffersomyces spartinae]
MTRTGTGTSTGTGASSTTSTTNQQVVAAAAADMYVDVLFSPNIQSQLFGVHQTSNLLPKMMLLSSPMMGSNPGHHIKVKPPYSRNKNMNEPGYVFTPSLPNYTNSKLADGKSPALGNSALLCGDLPLTDADLAVLDSIPIDNPVSESTLWNSDGNGNYITDIGPLQLIQYHSYAPNQFRTYQMPLVGSPITVSSETNSAFNSGLDISEIQKYEPMESRSIPSLPSQSFSHSSSQNGARVNINSEPNKDLQNVPFNHQSPPPNSNQGQGNMLEFDPSKYTNTVGPNTSVVTSDQYQVLSSRPSGVISHNTTNQTSPQFSPVAGSQRQSSISSLPIDQLNLLSIQASKSPSPNDYVFSSGQVAIPNSSNGNNNSNSVTTNSNTNTSTNTTPNPNTYSDNTINPKKLFRSHRLISTSLSSPSLTTLFKDSIYSIQNHYPGGKRYSQGSNNQGNPIVLNANHNSNQPISFPAISNLPLVTSTIPHGVNPSSRSSSTSASSSTTVGTTDTAITEIIPPASLNMNDECFNAISYWLNNSDNDENNMIHNPTGVMMNRNLTLNNGMGQNYSGLSNSTNTKQRRNSIQSSNPSNYINHNWYILKRKRRKSSTNGNGMEDRQQVKDLLLSLQQNLQTHPQTSEENEESSIFISNGVVSNVANGNSFELNSFPITNHQRSNSLNNPNLNTYLIEEQDGEGITMAIDSPQPHIPNENEIDANALSSNQTTDMIPPRASLNGVNGNPGYAKTISKGATRATKSDSKDNYKPVVGGVLEKQAIQLEITNSATNTTTTVTVIPHGSGDNIIFGCPLCDKQFKRSEHLKRHHRSVHSNIRPFHCTFCEKKFSRLDNLAQHLKTHYKMGANSGPGGRRRKESV